MFRSNGLKIFAALMVAASFSVASAKGGSPKASTAVKSDIRLKGVIESEEGELVGKYRNRSGKILLVMAAGGFSEGDSFEAFVGNMSVGTMTLAFDAVEGVPAGELEFESEGSDLSAWAAGVPLNLSAGTSISFTNLQTGEMMSGTLEEK